MSSPAVEIKSLTQEKTLAKKSSLCHAENMNKIQEASLQIQKGEVVAFPTETVYGLGADAFNEAAIQKIYALKGRPSSNPLIVHIADLNDLELLARPLNAIEKQLVTAFWPGPLTLILDKKETVPMATTGGLSTVAVRMPAHPMALELIKRAGTPIAAPSANLSGKPSATHHDHVRHYFGDQVFCLEGGATQHGLESTVVHVKGNEIHVYRLGSILPEDLSTVTEKNVILETRSIHSPGTQFKHYAPKARVELISKKIWDERVKKAEEAKEKVALLAPKEWMEVPTKFPKFSLGSEENLVEIGANLYRALITMDQPTVDTLFLPAFPEQGLGKTLMDRLKRAAEIEGV